MHLKLRYYIEHHYDPKARCMVFHLDYSRRSDLDDSVGYWYVEPTGRATSRVFYSCECKLRGWVPPPVYNLLTKEALSKATGWVERESVKAYKSSGNPFAKLADGAREAFDTLQRQTERLASVKLPELTLPTMPELPQIPMPALPQPERLSRWLDGQRARAGVPSALRLSKVGSSRTQ